MFRTPEEVAQGKIQCDCELISTIRNFGTKINQLPKEKSILIYCSPECVVQKLANTWNLQWYNFVYHASGGLEIGTKWFSRLGNKIEWAQIARKSLDLSLPNNHPSGSNPTENTIRFCGVTYSDLQRPLVFNETFHTPRLCRICEIMKFWKSDWFAASASTFLLEKIKYQNLSFD